MSLNLDRMTVEEKLRVMADLWDDLCRRAGGIESPGWHGEVLRERRVAVDRGQDEFEDWETAKGRIEDEIR